RSSKPVQKSAVARFPTGGGFAPTELLYYNRGRRTIDDLTRVFMENNSIKTQLLALLPVALKAHHDFIDSLSDTERAAVGTPQEWAAKDILSHCTFWQEVESERLAAAMRGETPPNTDDFQSLNEASFTARRDHSWSEAKANLDQCFQQFAKQIQALSE